MKKRNLYTALRLMMACALLTACTNETLPPADGTDPGSPTTLTATLADDTDTGNAPDTRLSHENDGSTTTPGVIVKWTVGDAFKLYPAMGTSSGMEYEIKNAEDITGEGKTAIFTATTSTGNITGEAKAIYPAAAALKSDGAPATTWNSIYLSMDGQTQTGDDNYAHTPAYDYMAADVADASSLPTGNDLAFHHLAAMMTVKITGKPSDYTPVTSPDAADNSPVQLTLSADGSGAGFYRMMSANGSGISGSASLRLENITWGDGGFTAHLMIFPTDFTKLATKTFTISVLCKDGTTYRYTTPQIGKKYVAGMRYTATIPGGNNWKKAESGTATERLDKDTYASGAFYLGNGTSSSPYLISSAAELKLLQERVNNGNQAYEYYRLTTDIMIADDVTWEPIGISSHVFNGNFDGGGHTISGTLSGSKSVFGFFGYVTDGHIRNLRIAATVRNSYEDGAGCSTGGLVGYPQRVTISGCSYKGTVIGGKSTNDASNTGGLIGQSKTITLSGCTVEADSKVQGGSAGGTAGSYTGGLVGYAAVGSRLESCTNYAEIAGATDSRSYAGGVAGHVSGNSNSPTSIHNCRNHGKVGIEGGANKDCYAGGLIGTVQDYTTLSDSRNTGDVTGGKTSGYNSYTGGLVANLSGNNEIIGCTNEGTVSGGTAKTYCYTGGLVGYNRGTLHTSRNTAKAAVAAGQLTGSSTNNENFTGGLVGGNTTAGTVYSCCTNAATVDGSPASSTAGSDNRIGGGDSTTVTDCPEGHIP